jgi:hypothetical protein
VQFALTRKEAAGALRHVYRPTFALIALIELVITVLIAVAARPQANFHGSVAGYQADLGLGVALLFTLVTVVLGLVLVRRVARRYERTFSANSYTCAPDRVVIEQPAVGVRIDTTWDGVRGVVTNAPRELHLLVLYDPPHMFPIPRRGFSGAQAEGRFMELVEQHGKACSPWRLWVTRRRGLGR